MWNQKENQSNVLDWEHQQHHLCTLQIHLMGGVGPFGWVGPFMGVGPFGGRFWTMDRLFDSPGLQTQFTMDDLIPYLLLFVLSEVTVSRLVGGGITTIPSRRRPLLTSDRRNGRSQGRKDLQILTCRFCFYVSERLWCERKRKVLKPLSDVKQR